MIKFIKNNLISLIIFLILFVGASTVLATITTSGNFPVSVNYFEDGAIIQAGDWNNIEKTIGETSTTSKSTLHGKWNDLFASTTLPQITTLLNLTSLGTIVTGVWNGTAIGDLYISDTLTIDSSSTVDKGALSNSGILSFDWSDSEIADNITASNYLSLSNWFSTTTAPQITTLTGLSTLGSSGATTTAFGIDISEGCFAISGTCVGGGGGGDVTKVGTPVNNQIGIWTGDGTLEGTSTLVFETGGEVLAIGDTNSNLGRIRLYSGVSAGANAVINVNSSMTGSNSYTLPAGGTTLVGRTSTDTLTNKTLTTPTIQNLTDNASVQTLILKGSDRTTPTSGDIEYISFMQEDDSSTFSEFARISSLVSNSVSTTKQGSLLFNVQKGNSLTKLVSIGSNDSAAASVGIFSDTTSNFTSNQLFLSDTGGSLENKNWGISVYNGKLGFRSISDSLGSQIIVANLDKNGSLYIKSDLKSGTKNLTNYANYYNGSFYESFNATTTSDGTTVTMNLANSKVYTDGLTMRFSTGDVNLPTATSTILTVGTDASPQENFVYIPVDTQALTVSTTAFPTNQEHIRVGYFLVPSALFVQSDGVYANQNWNDHAQDDNNQGEASLDGDRMRREPARYHSGVDANGTSSYLTPTASNVELKSTSGVVYQKHAQAFSAVDTSTGDTVLVKNWSGDAYHNITNLFDITTDSTGATISNNKYFNLVIWGVANKAGEYSPIMINLPGGFYNQQSSAENDTSGFDDLTIPNNFKGESSTGFLIARMTIQMGTTWTVASTVDLRGLTPQSATGGTAGGSLVNFPDNTFTIFDETDSTKIGAFDIGTNITTGTTRTLSFPDSSGTIITSGNLTDITSVGTLTGTTTVTNLNVATAIDFMGEYFTNFTTYVRSLFTGGTGISITAGDIAIDFTEFNTDSITEGATNLFNQTHTGDVTGSVALTISADSVALTTDTTGNYTATVADAGNSTITVVNGTAEGGAVTLDAVDLNCTDCIGTTEISDVYLLNSGDTATGDYTLPNLISTNATTTNMNVTSVLNGGLGGVTTTNFWLGNAGYPTLYLGKNTEVRPGGGDSFGLIAGTDGSGIDFRFFSGNSLYGTSTMIFYDNTSGTVFNEESEDRDFRVEGDTDANLFKIDAGNDTVAVSTLTGLIKGATGVLSAITTSSGVAGEISDETGTGAMCFATDPVFSGSIQIPNGTAPVVDALGEIAIDSTSDQLIYYGSSKRVVLKDFDKSLILASSTLSYIGSYGAAGTTTMTVWFPKNATTIDSIYAKPDVGTTTIRFGDGVNWSDTETCGFDVPCDDSTLANNTFTSRESFQIQIGQQVGDPSVITIVISGSETAD